MENIRLVNASLTLSFEPGSQDDDLFCQEYYHLALFNDEPIGQWLKSSRIRKESEQSDPVLLTLLVDLHRKVDTLTRLVQNHEKPLHVPLSHEEAIDAVGHGYFQIQTPLFETGKTYYGRIALPTFPTRIAPVFCEATGANLAKITLMHEEDVKEWDIYMASCERAMIRQMKGHGSEH